ncbi:hypothetical protein PGTUg99_023684 [Puccinia graminis f. sp. tritici]|uniref:Uncharacterized protein n=1 Tax=Puccinia graminis f. sp. tritici TaxID=56615 RepID=A0A5B0RV58_PUCGR|nr:hypothetical protein PGTUg99_023684 [Puccinia graminis f. sp. tritici]
MQALVPAPGPQAVPVPEQGELSPHVTSDERLRLRKEVGGDKSALLKQLIDIIQNDALDQ